VQNVSSRRSLLRFFRRAVPSLAPLGSRLPSRREPRHSGIPLLSPYLSPSPFSSFATCRSRTRARVYALSSALFSFSNLIPSSPPPPRSFFCLFFSLLHYALRRERCAHLRKHARAGEKLTSTKRRDEACANARASERANLQCAQQRTVHVQVTTTGKGRPKGDWPKRLGRLHLREVYRGRNTCGSRQADLNGCQGYRCAVIYADL